MEVKDVLKFSATGLAGLFAGGALYVNAADHGARNTMDTKHVRHHWKEAFIRARRIQGSMAVLGSLSGVGAYYFDDGPEKYLWLVGSGLFFAGLPWTMFVMKPDIKKLLKDDVIDTAGETWVRDHITRWNKLHAVRTLLSMAAFDVFMYALTRH